MKYSIIKSFALCFTLLVAACAKETSKISYLAGNLNFEFDESGKLVTMSDSRTKKDYLFKGPEAKAIMAIRVNGELEYPLSIKVDGSEQLLTLNYPKNNIDAQIQIEEKDSYLTLELISITHVDSIELVLWGPFETTINETIGETVGVVRNSDFSIGIQALNKRTLGGYPSAEDDATPSYDIFGTTSLVDVSDSLNILYRGHTALPKRYGSSLQAYTRNRNEEQVVAAMNHEQYMVPAHEDEGIVGSKIALFGCPPEDVLNTLEAIELGEGLPHPELNGVWSKRSPLATSAYLIQNFSTKTIDDAIALTHKAGLNYLYHSGPFENWGHFDLHQEAFPQNWESMKECVEKANQAGLELGVHTLSNFITTNDPYVTPVPDNRLAKVGTSVLVNSITVDEKNIEIASPTYFNQMKNNSLHTVMVGNELIQYENVSETLPWTLLNCQRGAFGTKAETHGGGESISKLADHGYKTFLTNAHLGKEMAERIADFYNRTGLKQISFDGLEGNYSSGMGAYGELIFVDAWFQNLKPEIKNGYIMDASRPGHFFWHMFTRMNWGEPWYAGFRESQTSYRLLNQDYFRRNFIPCMLGWFSMRDNTSIEDIEWMLARSAAFDAGYALVTSVDLVAKNGFGDEILEKIKQWEKARMSGAFSMEQKKRMENISDEFSLRKVTTTTWELIPFSVHRFSHPLKIRQPGEPVWSVFSFENKYSEQPLQFILTTKNTSVSAITMEFDNFKKVELNISIDKGEYLKYDGGNEVILYDSTWNRLKSIPIEADTMTLSTGMHEVKVDCEFSKREDDVGLKLELKTAGDPEEVAVP